MTTLKIKRQGEKQTADAALFLIDNKDGTIWLAANYKQCPSVNWPILEISAKGLRRYISGSADLAGITVELDGRISLNEDCL